MKSQVQESKIVALQPGDSVENFIACIQSGVEQIKRGSEMLVRLYKNDPGVIDQIHDEAPHIPAGFLSRMLRVGEHSLRPELILNGCPAYHRIAQLPYESQGALLKAGAIDLVTNPESGDTLRVKLVDLSPSQATLAIAPTGPRSKDDQRAYLKRLSKPVSKAKDDDYPWLVKKDRVIVNRPCELTKKDILSILSELP